MSEYIYIYIYIYEFTRYSRYVLNTRRRRIQPSSEALWYFVGVVHKYICSKYCCIFSVWLRRRVLYGPRPCIYIHIVMFVLKCCVSMHVSEIVLHFLQVAKTFGRFCHCLVRRPRWLGDPNTTVMCSASF